MINLTLTVFEGLTALSAYNARGVGLDDPQAYIAEEIREAFSPYVDFETNTLIDDAEHWHLELSKAAVAALFDAAKIFKGYKPLGIKQIKELVKRLEAILKQSE